MFIYIDEDQFIQVKQIIKELGFLATRKDKTPKGKPKITVECKQGDLATFYHDIDLIENLVSVSEVMRDIVYKAIIQKIELERDGY